MTVAIDTAPLALPTGRPSRAACPLLSSGGEQRDFVDKHEEYLRVGVREYWILDTEHRRMHALVREGDTWEETIVPESDIYHTVFLPGLQVRPAELLGPASVL